MFSDKYDAIETMLNEDTPRIVTLKLISGEEIVVDAKISNNVKDSLVVYNPLKIIEVNAESVVFTRWMVSSLRRVYPIDYSEVMVITRPSKRVINAYFQRTKVVYDESVPESEEE